MSSVRCGANIAVHIVMDDSGSMYNGSGRLMECLPQTLTAFQSRLSSLWGIDDATFHVFSHMAKSGKHLEWLIGEFLLFTAGPTFTSLYACQG